MYTTQHLSPCLAGRGFAKRSRLQLGGGGSYSPRARCHIPLETFLTGTCYFWSLVGSECFVSSIESGDVFATTPLSRWRRLSGYPGHRKYGPSTDNTHVHGMSRGIGSPLIGGRNCCEATAQYSPRLLRLLQKQLGRVSWFHRTYPTGVDTTLTHEHCGTIDRDNRASEITLQRGLIRGTKPSKGTPNLHPPQ